MKFYILAFILLLQTFNVLSQSKNDTFSVYFDLDIAELNDKAKGKMDALYYNEKIKNNVPISIIGYADYLATEEYNLELSRTRALNVKQYLKSFGINEGALKIVIGKGEVKRKDTLRNEKQRGVSADRRVDIVMEYIKPASSDKGDMVIKMRPGDKLLIPPSTSDPDFQMENIEVGKSFILQNIYFPMGRHFPKESSYEELTMLVEVMQQNPSMMIQIEGHVCCISNVADAYDLDTRQMDLSINRARFIYEYLRTKGIETARLNYIGYGKSRPIIADEQTQEEASRNRRVEIRILRK